MGSRLTACCKLAPTLARQMWRHNYVIDHNEYPIFTLLESINPWVYSLQFLFKCTNNSWRYEWKCEWVFFFWTQCRLYGRRILQVKRPNQQYQRTEGERCKAPKNKENTNYTCIHTQNSIQIQHTQIKTASSVVYNNMGWLGDGSHRGQGC